MPQPGPVSFQHQQRFISQARICMALVILHQCACMCAERPEVISSCTRTCCTKPTCKPKADLTLSDLGLLQVVLDLKKLCHLLLQFPSGNQGEKAVECCFTHESVSPGQDMQGCLRDRLISAGGLQFCSLHTFVRHIAQQ